MYSEIKNLVPYQYFITRGIGNSKHTLHAGSYHMALYKAGIHTANIMTYSSILPKESNEVEQDIVNIHYGQELKCIMSVMNGRYGESISAGIGIGKLYKKEKDGTKGDYIGSLVVERNGYFNIDDLQEHLQNSLYELYNNTFDEYLMPQEEITYISENTTVDDVYGTVLVSLCFINYLMI